MANSPLHASRDSSKVSPTAHYPSYVWLKNGLSHEALLAPRARYLRAAMFPVNGLARVAGVPDVEANLLLRHRVIDERLEDAIVTGRIGQVVEIACGLSPRGFRFSERHPSLRYIEADLPKMAERKRNALHDAGLFGAHHEVVDLDARAVTGPASLEALTERLDSTVGTAFVTEGLINYFDRASVEALWRRFARLLERFPVGLYFADTIFSAEVQPSLFVRGCNALLARLARGFHVHHRDPAECRSALVAAGFAGAIIHLAGRPEVIRVVEASIGR